MSKIKILDLPTHDSNDNSEIVELLAQELNITGAIGIGTSMLLVLFANPFA